MTDVTYRNHPTVMIRNILIIGFVMLYISFSARGSSAMLIGVVVLFALLCIFVVLFWAKTTITFGPNEAVVNINVLYKRKKIIPYKKVASVNVVRDIFNRIFGTTTLNISINSSRNAAVPDARFVFDSALAEQIRDKLTSDLFGEEPAEEDSSPKESLVDLSMKDSVMHSLFGISTYQLLYAIGLLAYSVFSTLFFESSGVFLALILLIIGEVVPTVFNILKYGNFKVYRINDQIHLQHGIIQNYVSKFDINRINAIRIKRTFFARMIGKSCLEAEVVGINAIANDVTPLLCILTDEDKIEALIKQLVPEFIHHPEMMKQPKEARIPLLVKSVFGAMLTIAIMAYPCWWTYSLDDVELSGLSPLEALLFRYALTVVAVAAIAVIFFAAHTSLKVREFGLGSEMFNLVNGLVDRKTTIIQYDRVQITKVSAGPMPRRLGLAKCTVSLLSSQGYKNISSGYFRKEELYKIGEVMLQRLKDGTYRYEKNST
ncbi:MAG: PH domain-containing protein [Candidatus Methanoplasma sp.]|jgi:putative membrane protein|nr:PH domain-containing protein [Candidatus Methanoplasma sp.]